MRTLAWAAAALAFALGACATQPPAPAPLPYHVGGRAVCDAHGCTRQWPGSYFETAFVGERVLFRLGEGDAQLKISIDGETREILRSPAAGQYEIGPLAPGPHVARIDVIGENHAEASRFLGFFAPPGVATAPLRQRARQIEIIGDSQSAGYANTSTTRDCTDAEVRATSDATQTHGALLAARYGADYRINAISGRGVVRNYNGGGGDTLPAAYGYTLFDHSAAADDSGWAPDLVIVGLGANDFSTPLRAGERWADRAALRADFETAYADFLATLRARFPAALLLVWSAAGGDGERETAVARAVERARQAGVARLSFTAIEGLSLAACHWHPDTADARLIAAALAQTISAH